jgi:hypothetical protein
MSKLVNNREILYFQTAVLAEPSDHSSGRSSQNSWNFFLYKTQPQCVGLVRKVDPPPLPQSKTTTCDIIFFKFYTELTGEKKRVKGHFKCLGV